MTHRITRFLSGVAGNKKVVLVAFATVLLISRLELVAHYTSAIPFWDEWDATIDILMRKFLSGTVSVFDLFTPHNEHVVFFTQLTSVIALWLNNGQFDNIPVVIFNQLIYCVAWTYICSIFISEWPGKSWLYIFVLCAISICPLGNENTLTGFQNYIYFLILGTVILLWAAAKTRELTVASTLGFALGAFATTLTMGSGFVGPMAGCAICLVRAFHEPRLRTALFTRSAICLSAAAFGCLLLLHNRAAVAHVPDSPFFEYFARFFSCLAWPAGFSAAIGMAATIPFALFMLRFRKPRVDISSIDYFVLGCGLWVIAQAAVHVLGRQADAHLIMQVSRYRDIFIFWPLVNIFCLCRLVDDARKTQQMAPYGQWLPWIPGAAMIVLFGWAVAMTPNMFIELRTRGAYYSEGTRRVSEYVITGYSQALEPTSIAPYQVPYPSPQRLKLLLDDPLLLRGLQQAIVKPALHIGSDAGYLRVALDTLLYRGSIFICIVALFYLLGKMLARRNTNKSLFKHIL